MGKKALIPDGLKTKAVRADVSIEARERKGRHRLRYRFFRVKEDGDRVVLTGWMSIADAHRYLDTIA